MVFRTPKVIEEEVDYDDIIPRSFFEDDDEENAG